MKISYLASTLLVLNLFSCEKEKSTDDDLKVIPGEIALNLNGDFTSNHLFDFLNNEGLNLKSCQGLVFYTDLPEDSLTFIKNKLEKLAFISDYQIKMDHQFQQIIIRPNFFDLQIAQHQGDWLQAISDLELSQLDSPYFLILDVEQGKEEEFILKFQKKSFVKLAQQNALVRYSAYRH